MNDDQIRLLFKILPEVTESYAAMLADLRRRADDICQDVYSDDLKMWILCGKLLEIACK